jgi:hypothetical protein
MEDILEVYQRPYDPQRPVVCMDEASKQLLEETREPLGVCPGRVKREDYEGWPICLSFSSLFRAGAISK